MKNIEIIQKQREIGDEKIDALVYELYELTNEEINLIKSH